MAPLSPSELYHLLVFETLSAVENELCRLETIDTDIFEVFYDDVNPVRSFPVSFESGSSLILKCEKDSNKRITLVVGCQDGKQTSSVPDKCGKEVSEITIVSHSLSLYENTDARYSCMLNM